MKVRPDPVEDRPEERTGGNVEGLRCEGLDQRGSFIFGRGFEKREADRSVRLYVLRWKAIAAWKSGAQDLMPPYDLRESGLDAFVQECAFDAEGTGEIVGSRLLNLREKPKSLLRERERQRTGAWCRWDDTRHRRFDRLLCGVDEAGYGFNRLQVEDIIDIDLKAKCAPDARDDLYGEQRVAAK